MSVFTMVYIIMFKTKLKLNTKPKQYIINILKTILH